MPNVPAILFDFDNTIASTNSIQEIRENGDYEQLTPETMAKVRPYKPVPELLKAIREAGVKIGIVTNSGRGYVRRVLEHIGLKDAFDTIVTYTDVKRDGMKPSPKGIQLALKNLGVEPSPVVLYVGDDDHDHVASYRAGVKPVMPSWATKKPVSTAPALELSSAQLLEYLADPDGYKLFAERAAELGTATYERKAVYFLPLDDSANVVTMQNEMTSFCLGRYFSQKASATALIHETHTLSQEIQRKETQDPFVLPNHWAGVLAHTIRNGPAFVFGDAATRFEVVTVVPGKSGKDPRLERLLQAVDQEMAQDAVRPAFVPDLFYYIEGAQSQKNLRLVERSFEANRSLQISPNRAATVKGKRVLIIDDVTTTGATMLRARTLALDAGAASAHGVALAKTVSILEEERPCPVCARSLRVKRNSKTGEHFWGCTGFSDQENPCKYAEPLLMKPCPVCERPMRIRTNGRTGEKFWSCSGWKMTPSCNHTEDVVAGDLPSS